MELFGYYLVVGCAGYVNALEAGSDVNLAAVGKVGCRVEVDVKTAAELDGTVSPIVYIEDIVFAVCIFNATVSTAVDDGVTCTVNVDCGVANVIHVRTAYIATTVEGNVTCAYPNHGIFICTVGTAESTFTVDDEV